jgi:hypothetical protein
MTSTWDSKVEDDPEYWELRIETLRERDEVQDLRSDPWDRELEESEDE